MSRWDQEYRTLSEPARQAVNELTNGIFRHQSGFAGKIDPHHHPELAAQWLAIRNQVLANRHQFAQWLQGAISGAMSFAPAAMILRALDTTPAWIRTARGELGIHEIKGATHNPRIMDYIRTCSNILQNDAQRRYVEREGEEGVEWCSAFVNWCLRQNGIAGTDNALASSWQNWGTALTGPKRGAIVGFNWSGGKSIAHVAFCDEEDGKFFMLGGNQTDTKSGGRVSRVNFSRTSARYYRWPPGVPQ